MNWLKTHRNNKKLSILVGLFLAFTIIATQSYSYQFIPQPNDIEINIDGESENKAPQYVSQDAVSVSTVQLNFSKPFQVVFEFILSEDEDNEAEPKSVPLNFEFFKTLFRISISPNAP